MKDSAESKKTKRYLLRERKSWRDNILKYTTTLYHYTILLQNTTTLHHYTISLHYSILLHYITTVYHYSISLQYTTDDCLCVDVNT